MYTLLYTEDPSTIAVEIEGTVTEEDAQQLDHHVEEHFGSSSSFNVFVVFNEVDRTSLKQVVEGSTFNQKRRDQFDKFAILSDKTWLKFATKAGGLLPGLSMKHFDKDETDKAWSWLQES
ncbi:STAS/SEC14 domain-containing protein [Sinobaca sp. H24]|uniref:STAS/SEC14 domain-containing protein n=1 Tax=Sinobaca sp. H24 TaxID=2923376 RepID=UPI00207A0D5B|nr:STAS/SEC14 domain-containing protein [Sinobaca sp. H24]